MFGTSGLEESSTVDRIRGVEQGAKGRERA
jgi:hypothetical protein